ncbi:MAG: hypothetical protein IRZ24_08895 [Thermogemmatispora sp.]|nr:hypothetical protein [Thermogemmatispora sp.]
MDFQWPASYLNKKWQDYQKYRLCNDHYTWDTVTFLPVQQVLQTLRWPSDLLNAKYMHQPVALQPLSSFDPNTKQALQQQQQEQKRLANQSTGPCDWVPDLIFVHPHIDVCAPLRLLINAGSAAIRTAYQGAQSQIGFLWQTPLKPFQDDKSSGLLTIWVVSWSIVLATVPAVLAYASLRYMIGAINWLSYADTAELISRVLLGLLAAYFSKQFFIMLIQVSNALTGIFNNNSLDTVINGHPSGVVAESLQILYGLMGFLLIIEGVARIAIIYMLFAFAPILFFFATLRETQRWAKMAAGAAIIFVFIQPVQVAALDIGGKVLATVLHNTGGQLTFLNLLVSLAVLYITLALFFFMAHLGLGTGAYPLGTGVMGALALSRGALSRTAGYVGSAADAYRQARRNLFPLPSLTSRGPSTSNGSGGDRRGGGGGAGGSSSPGPRPGGSGFGGGRPEVSSGRGGSSSNNPGVASPGGAKTSSTSPGNPSKKQGSASIASSAPGSREAGHSSAPTSNNARWQKTPLRPVPRPSIRPRPMDSDHASSKDEC